MENPKNTHNTQENTDSRTTLSAVSKNLVNLDSICKKMRFKILPLIVLMFCLSMLDRSNIGFVKNHIAIDAGISEAAYALGAGLFFIGYALFEIPSNLLLHKLGAKIWLSRIMISWGIVTMCMIFIHDSTSFYILRFLLGLTEAGFSPGIILYLSYFFPSSHRSSAYGIYQMGVPIAFIFGAPISGAILEYMPPFYFSNWQWMFIIQGFATILVGILAFFVLSSKPSDAKWLTQEEKEILQAALNNDTKKAKKHSILSTFGDYLVWRFVFVYFCVQLSNYAVVFYLPTRIADFLGTNVGFYAGVLTAIPWIAVFIALPFVTRLADRKKAWRIFAMSLLGLAVCSMILASLSTSLWIFLPFISFAAIGFIVVQPIFWNLPTQMLSSTSAAAGIALIGSLGNLGGFIAPNLKSFVESATQNSSLGLVSVALVALFGVFTLMFLKNYSKG